MGKRGPKSPFLKAWEGRAEVELRVMVPAGFKSMLETYAEQNGTTCSSVVRHSVLKAVVGGMDANRLEPDSLRNPSKPYPGLALYTVEPDKP